MSTGASLERDVAHRGAPGLEWVELSPETKNVGPTPAPALPRAPIPPHLLKGTIAKGMKTRNGTKPVGGKRGKLKKMGWRNITAGHVVDYGYKAWQLAKHLATLVNVEDKKWDVDGTSGTLITSTATVVNLSNIAQGTDYFNRAGDSILGQGIEFRAYARNNSAVNGNLLRVLIVVDRMQRGTDPVIGDVLQGGTTPLLQPINATSGNRWEVLYDELLMLNSPGVGLATAGTSTTYMVNLEHLPALNRKWNKHVLFTSSAGADASNWQNAIYMMAVSDQATNGPTLHYTFRLHFTDN